MILSPEYYFNKYLNNAASNYSKSKYRYVIILSINEPVFSDFFNSFKIKKNYP